MKHKGFILLILIVMAVIVITSLPKDRLYKEVAAVGKPAPEFELTDFNGKTWRLSDLRGKVVFISFWATWCTSCKAEMPYKESLFNKMRGKGFQMLGVLSRDNPKNLPSYLKKYSVSPPTLIDHENEVARLYGLTGVPETFIIDKEGIVREKIIGPRQWDSPESAALIEKWL